MSYITQSDLYGQISESELIQLTDDAHLGIVDTAVVSKAIADAEAEVNSYLATKVAVPIAPPVPDLVKKLSIDKTIYNLYRRRKGVVEPVNMANEHADKMLKDFVRGASTLGIDPPLAASTQASQGAVLTNDSEWSRDKLSDF
jgi:phage gp36-like protein